MTTILLQPPPTVSPPVPLTELPNPFPLSAELGDQLNRLAKAQAEIDRYKAEELARLRVIQSRD